MQHVGIMLYNSITSVWVGFNVSGNTFCLMSTVIFLSSVFNSMTQSQNCLHLHCFWSLSNMLKCQLIPTVLMPTAIMVLCCKKS